MTGYISKLESMGTLDGPGVRAVVFGTGCPLRCIYCHNPETWDARAGEAIEVSTLAERIIRLYPYIKRGGVTFSGGEPCLQAEFFSELAGLLRKEGLHIALDTSGAVINDAVLGLLGLVDLVLLDVKFTDEESYKRYTGGTLSRTLEFLSTLDERRIPTWIRHVTVPGINDTEEDIRRLRELIAPYRCVERVELLPFRKLCLEKYSALGIQFPLSDTPEMSTERIAELQKGLN